MAATARRLRSSRAITSIALVALVLGVGIGAAVGRTGAATRGSAVTRGDVERGCSTAGPYRGGSTEIQLLGAEGSEERFTSGRVMFCAADASASSWSWRYRIAPIGGSMQVLYTTAIVGAMSFLRAPSSVRSIVMSKPGLRTARIRPGYWVVYVPGDYVDLVQEATSRFDIGVASGLDREGDVVAFSPIYLCPDDGGVVSNTCP